MKNGLDRTVTGMQTYMHWNVAPDALPEYARLVRVLDR